MRIIEIKVYEIHEHPNKKKCFEWIRNNWHDLNSYSVTDIVNSITALSKKIGGTVEYSISQTPDNKEHITFKGYDKNKLLSIPDDTCSLTGVYWDEIVVKALKDNYTNGILNTLYTKTEYVYSDDGLNELCVGNEYEFKENGEVV